MKYLHLIIFPLLLSACAGTVTTLPTATNISKPPTITATFTLVPTITPTAVSPITNLTAWEKSEGERIAKEAGFASYAEYVQKKLVENPAYDTKSQLRGDITEPYTYVAAEGLVMEQATVPVLSEYWKSKGTERAEVLLMAFENTAQPVSILTGFHLKDSTYVSMLPLEVGVDGENRNQDILLKKPSDLKHLVGQLRSIRMVKRITPSPNFDFLETSGNWDKLKEISKSSNEDDKYYNIFGIRTAQERKFFEDALYNREGYIWSALHDAEGKLRSDGIYKELFSNPPEELQALLDGGRPDDATNMVAVMAYLLSHGGGGVDSWMVVLTLGQNGTVVSR